jgi:hypothetical protein
MHGTDDSPRGSVPSSDGRADVPAWIVAGWRWGRTVCDRAAWPHPWSAGVLSSEQDRRLWWLWLAVLLRCGPNLLVPALLAGQALYGWPEALTGVRLFAAAGLAGAAGLWGTILARRESAESPTGVLRRGLAWSCENTARELFLALHPVVALALAGWPDGGGLAVYGLLAIAAGVAWTIGDTRPSHHIATSLTGDVRPNDGVDDQEIDDEGIPAETESGQRLPAPGYCVWRTSGEDGSVSATGEVCVDVRAGARMAVAHVPLFPPWQGTPRCECRVVAGEARVTWLATPHGARLEIKRAGDLSRPTRVWVEVRFDATAGREAA